MKKKKVLYIVTKSNWGGAQRYVFDLATNLPKDQFEAVAACGGSGLLIEKLEKSGIRVIKIRHLERKINIMKEALSLFSLWRIFKKEKPDIIHLNSSKVGGLGALAARIYNLKPKSYKLKAKVVFTAHGWPFQENRNIISKLIIWKLSWFTSLLSHHTVILTKSDLEATEKFPFVSSKKIHHIPNGIKEQSRVRPYYKRGTARKELGLNLEPGITLLGCITEFTKNKGIRYLIEAMKELPESAHLALIGDGSPPHHNFICVMNRLLSLKTVKSLFPWFMPTTDWCGGGEKSQMEKLAKDLRISERIHFLGFKKDAAKFLKAFDVFVFPSIKEGLPYALLEAGLAELPIVAANIGGIPDIITDGENGLLVEPKNPHALAEAIKKLLENKELREKLGKKISEKIKMEFSFEKMLEETISLYS